LIVRASELEVIAKEVTAIIKAQIRCRFEGMVTNLFFASARAEYGASEFYGTP